MRTGVAHVGMERRVRAGGRREITRDVVRGLVGPTTHFQRRDGLVKRFALLIVGCLIASALVNVGTAYATCGTGGTLFKPWNTTQCTGTELFASNASTGTSVNVQNDIVSSAKNATNNKWCFVNEALVDSTIWILGPSSAVGLMGSEDNKTDHFDIVWSGGSCPA